MSRAQLAFPTTMPRMFVAIGLVEALSSLLGFMGAAKLPGAVCVAAGGRRKGTPGGQDDLIRVTCLLSAAPPSSPDPADADAPCLHPYHHHHHRPPRPACVQA